MNIAVWQYIILYIFCMLELPPLTSDSSLSLVKVLPALDAELTLSNEWFTHLFNINLPNVLKYIINFHFIKEIQYFDNKQILVLVFIVSHFNKVKNKGKCKIQISDMGRKKNRNISQANLYSYRALGANVSRENSDVVSAPAIVYFQQTIMFFFFCGFSFP